MHPAIQLPWFRQVSMMSCTLLKNNYIKEEIIKSINRDPQLSTVALGMGVDCHDVTQIIMCFHPQMLNHTEVQKDFYSWGCYIRSRGNYHNYHHDTLAWRKIIFPLRAVKSGILLYLKHLHPHSLMSMMVMVKIWSMASEDDCKLLSVQLFI